MSPSSSENSERVADPRPWRFALLCVVLALGTAALYWPITHHPFIHFDDDQYIVANPHVTSGLSATNFVWAFTTSEQANWHPLTWISHQTDCTLFAVNPGAHHLVNLLYHIANTLLLLMFLRSATGAVWRSAVVAALFAWHPMHVESVAWASERKDVLSTFFWLLAMLAYLQYARSVPGADRTAGQGRGRAAAFYAAALVLCACGLMSKPMVVTLPCVLLLLDLWPLNRMAGFQHGCALGAAPACAPVSVIRLAGEKLPFFALAVAGSLATYLVQSGAGAVAGLPLSERLANAVLAYAQYIAKLFWPTDLALIYPHPDHWPLWLALTAVALLLVWTFLCLYRWRQVPYLVVGWFWFVGTLVPTIGLIQVGAQSMADRYTYIPSIGLFVVVAWGLTEYFALRDFRRSRIVLSLLAGAALIGCVGTTVHQIAFWQDSIPLFRHAIDVTTDNYVAENCLGKAYELVGNASGAMACYQLSVKTEARFPYSQFNLAMALLERGQTEEALEHLQVAARLEPRDPDIQYDLGIYFSQHNSWTNAAGCFSNSLVVRPGFAPAQLALGGALANLGRAEEAAAHLREALRLDPNLLPARTNLDRLLTEHPEVH
jgi:tetratricopeptide (TPR) repeat protein